MKLRVRENIAANRKRIGLSQSGLARKLGFTPASICHYENGDRLPNIKSVVKLAKLFKITTDQLIGLTK